MVKAGQWVLLPTSWFTYHDVTAMPKYVTAQIVKKVTGRGPAAYDVKMIGDGKPSINVKCALALHLLPAPRLLTCPHSSFSPPHLLTSSSLLSPPLPPPPRS